MTAAGTATADPTKVTWETISKRLKASHRSATASATNSGDAKSGDIHDAATKLTAFLSPDTSPESENTRGSPKSPQSPKGSSASASASAATFSNEPAHHRRTSSGGSSGSTRVRRKCTIDGCPNRVVQGGLCISHGAKRKQCTHPGCTKNVKKAGLCSSHGPARKKCEAEGCTRVSVRGGKCIRHGAKRRSCAVPDCTKQAVILGMCKRHHDLYQRDKKLEEETRTLMQVKEGKER